MDKKEEHEIAMKALYNRFHQASQEAAAMVIPQPMHVIVESFDETKEFTEPEGYCGFGWVHMKATHPFAKFCMRHGYAQKGYPSGVDLYSRMGTQSLERNKAYAVRFAELLNAVYSEHEAIAHAQMD